MTRRCIECGAAIEDTFRFCPHCGRAQRTKVVEWFRGDRRLDDGALRVSVYLTEPQHVRVSIWKHGAAEAAMSLEPPEAERLGAFLGSVTRHAPRGLRDHLQRALHGRR